MRTGRLRIDQPFLQLPNVIRSSHNPASMRSKRDVALRRAAANCRRVLDGLRPLHLAGEDERAGAPP